MHSSSSRRRPVRALTLKVSCVRICVFYSSMCLAAWPLSSEAARLRCGSELLSDLIFVCGDRGIYLGKGSWSGYGPRPRGKGIVDQCCKSSGCELQHLEMYCAKPKSKEPTSTTTTTTRTPTSTAMFQVTFQKRLLENLGAPDSLKRESYREKAQPQKTKSSSSRRRMAFPNATGRPPFSSTGPL
ncbi:insulin-like growth factor 3 [Nothobranchius furzeri]|uniref:Insulin-like growth factor 3 n=2 Tax=Nothobranchius TaxID=28779 RepID=A0A1A8VCX4_NOTFU|nr:insulin-like growth factor 3 [Nothobranchius furzeri]KAF7210537.1 insulin-like growth factor I [Nothobranchius furzeri]